MLSSLLLILFHRFEELTNSIKQLKNHKKIKDISKVLTGWFSNLLLDYISYYIHLYVLRLLFMLGTCSALLRDTM